MKPQHTRKTPTETIHSPTPWSYDGGWIHSGIYADKNNTILTVKNLHGNEDKKEANAAFIVQACNAHEALKISLNQALLDLKDLIDCGEIPPDALKHFKVTLEDGKAALKLAGEV